MIFKGIEICCPVCRNDLEQTGPKTEDRHPTSTGRSSVRGFRCVSCSRVFPVILDIPDLRVFPDLYIDMESDRAKGLQVAARMDELSFAELIDYYYSITPVVPPHHARMYKRGLMAAVERADSALAAWENVITDADPPCNVLDIGCGTAPMLVAAASRFERIVGIDIAFRWLVIAKKRLAEAHLDTPLICACAEALPFRGGFFDRVIADSVLEHLQDQSTGLTECRRVMKRGGYLCVATPNRFSLGPDPHIGLWAGGYLPDRWLAAYVRWQGGIPPKRRLLSTRSLTRLLRDATFCSPRIFLPDVSPGQSKQFGRGVQRIIDLYHFAKRLPVGCRLLQRIGPLLYAAARKSDVPSSVPLQSEWRVRPVDTTGVGAQ